MQKFVILGLLISTLVMAGCLPQSQSTPAPTATSSAGPAATSPARPTPTPVVISPTQASLSSGPGCTAISQKPTPGPTAESNFPAVNQADWVKGPADAKITIIEYSDFQ